MRPLPSANNSEPGRLARGARLLACVAALATCWLIVLPLLSRTPAIRSMIDRNEALGINPSAKFYSELPLMPATWERVRRSQDPAVPLTSDPRGGPRS